MNNNTIQMLTEIFNINITQAKMIFKVYLKELENISFETIYKAYMKALSDNEIVGTSFEKLSFVCESLNLELKGRFESKEGFLKWLFKKYKNRPCLALKENDFSYVYECYFGSEKRKVKTNCAEVLICVNAFSELCFKNGENVKSVCVEYEEALINFMFLNQNKIGVDLFVSKREVKALEAKPLSLEDISKRQKAMNERLYLENFEKFEKSLEQSFKSLKKAKT